MDYRKFCKALGLLTGVSAIILTGCSVNPATGQNQFAGLMSPQSEASIGAEQHQQVVKEYGGIYNNPALQSYVTSIGQKLARNTERADVTYQFFLLDSPIVNAFALPGGYVYVTRGLMAVANDEAEFAGVIGHEIGHVTGRHSAARYSQGVLASLGSGLLGAAIGNSAISEVLNTGSNLYISSYSRDQESEADTLGIRYLDRAGYDPLAVSDFLAAMDQYQSFQSGAAAKDKQAVDFFSTHPQTGSRVTAAAQGALQYQGGGQKLRNADAYLSAINGMTFGDSAEQGYVRGRNFYHPKMGFTFSVPDGFKIDNQPSKIVARGAAGALIIVDASAAPTSDASSYIQQYWLKGEKDVQPERITINGRQAATASFAGTVNGTQATIRLVAIPWSGNKMFRMQFAIPNGVSSSVVEAMKETTYSFRDLPASEAASLRPQRIAIVTANSGDTVQSLGGRMKVDRDGIGYFRALNNLKANESVMPGRKYKIITE